jgi:hypothetical protein
MILAGFPLINGTTPLLNSQWKGISFCLVKKNILVWGLGRVTVHPVED